MGAISRRGFGVLALGVCVVGVGCATTNTPLVRKWPAETPGSYPGRTDNTRNGEWWFPSSIGPMTIEGHGGNRGTLFYLMSAETPAPKRVQRVVYKRQFVDREVKVERLFFPAILFDTNSAKLTGEAEEQVRQAAAAIKQAKGHRIMVEGHRDTGEAAPFDAQRAEAVMKRLVQAGAAKQTLSLAPRGATHPLSQKDTELGHALNRRVTFTFIPADLDLDPTGPKDDPEPQIDAGTIVDVVYKSVTVERPKLVYVDRIIFPNILFAYDKADLGAKAVRRADTAAEIVQSLDNVKHVTMEGHCDSRGTDAYNASLSTRRADTVRKHLIERGVSIRTASSAGMGENTPIATNDTADGRQLNRRVEFRVQYR